MSDITWYSEGYEMAEKSGRLVEAFYGKRKKGKVISLTLMGQKCSIDFDKMQMTKDGEKKKYKLKRSDGSDSESEEESSSSSSTEEEATWEYKHTKKGWQPLKTGFQLALEKAYTGSKGSKSFDKKIGKETLTFDLKNMTKKDKSTGEKTKIRRVCDDESNSDSEPTPKKTKSKNTKKSSKYESESSEDDSPAPSKSKKEKEKAAAKKKSKRTEESDSDDEERTKSAKVTIKPKSVKSFGKKNLIKKGRGVVEPLSGKQADCHIYESGDDVFQCMLNQSNVHANNNKFYQIQLIESDSGGNWWVFTRWGRNGTPGSTGIKPFGTIAAAEKEFKTKFRAKTLNQWDSRDDFVKRPNQYQLMDITHGSDADSDSDAASENDTPCKLEPALKSVIELISDKKVMLQTMKQFEINTDELPLGMISKKQIKSAFQHLKHIDQELRKKNPSRKVLADESCGFYTLIPHVVGMKQLPIIRSDEMVQEKMTMLDALADIEVAGKILKDSKKSKQHPLDAAYEALHCQLNRITKDHGDFKLIKDYIANTHGPTHRTFSLDVEEVFAVDREGESERFTEEISNKTLLFHGSRNSNWMGILGQGLRIAPPEAPVTGYMFGKGVYFADCSSKSANYCKTSRKDNIGFMTLNEVALGKTHDLTAAKYIEKLPKGCQSTKGCGSHEPSTTMTCDNGINWPLGKLQESKYEDDTNLLYNEYVVYDVSQIRTKYLVKLKFNY